jgi:hypothetical protein
MGPQLSPGPLTILPGATPMGTAQLAASQTSITTSQLCTLFQRSMCAHPAGRTMISYDSGLPTEQCGERNVCLPITCVCAPPPASMYRA